MLNNGLKAGDRVRFKADPHWKGVIVGAGFGKPANGEVRVQLECGLTIDRTPYALEKIEKVNG